MSPRVTPCQASLGTINKIAIARTKTVNALRDALDLVEQGINSICFRAFAILVVVVAEKLTCASKVIRDLEPGVIKSCL